MKREYGFNLIEVTIGIAVIAILIALGFPEYQKYRATLQVEETMADSAALRLMADSCIQEDRLKQGTAAGECNLTIGTLRLIKKGAAEINTGKTLTPTTKIKLIFSEYASGVISGKTLEWNRISKGEWLCTFDGEAQYVPADC